MSIHLGCILYKIVLKIMFFSFSGICISTRSSGIWTDTSSTMAQSQGVRSDASSACRILVATRASARRAGAATCASARTAGAARTARKSWSRPNGWEATGSPFTRLVFILFNCRGGMQSCLEQGNLFILFVSYANLAFNFLVIKEK